MTMSMRQDVLPLVVGIVVVLVAGLAAMIFGPDDLSDDAVATLIAAALGILGTHIGHVSGHSLGRASKD
jgi:hypothetical protein